MANEGQWKAIVASKQLEIDKLKRKVKELEDQNNTIKNAIENEIEKRGLNDSARQRSTSNRKKNKRSEQSDSSD